jgi:Tfp pilus assembly protein PilN
MADKGGLQLLPENRKRIDIKIPGENRLIYIGIGLILLTLGVAGGLWAHSNNLANKIAVADEQIAALEKQRNSLNDAEQKLIILAKQMNITSQILKNHIYWSKGLSKIESALQSNIQFKSFSGLVSEDAFRVQALSDNYATIAKQLAAFLADDSIKDVTLDNVNSLTSGKLDFSSKIQFNRAKFLQNQ